MPEHNKTDELLKRIESLEEKLEERDRELVKHRMVMENIPVAITIYDEKGRFIFANEQAQKYLDTPSHIIVQKTLLDFFPNRGNKAIKMIKKVFSEKKTVTSKHQYPINNEKHIFNIKRFPISDSESNVKAVLSIAEDITQQDRTDNFLNIQHKIDSLQSVTDDFIENLTILFDHLFEIEWIDAGGLYLYDEEKEMLELVYHRGLSEKFTKKTGKYPIGSEPARLVFSRRQTFKGKEEFLPTVRKSLLEEKITYLSILPLIHKNKVIGSLNLASRNFRELSDLDKLWIRTIAGRVAGQVQLVRAQENLKKNNISLNKALQDLKKNHQRLIQKSRLESLGELSAGLAHEVNQPLSVISLSLQNLEERIKKGKADTKYLDSKFDSLWKNVEKIRSLIDHVRIFSREQGDELFERVDLNKTIDNALSLMTEQLRNHNISVVTDLEKTNGYVLGNSSQIEQIFLNLLANSRYALDEKQISAPAEEFSKEIRISSRAKDDNIEISFHDNGTGISEKNLEMIFDPFFTTKPEGEGTGLGLAIVYGIIKKMKGAITAESKQDENTEITIRLPFFRVFDKKI